MTPASDPEFDKTLTFCRGDAWGGIPAFAIEASPGVPPAADLARVRMQFRKNLVDTDPACVLAEITSDDAAKIIISSANGWTGSVPIQLLDLPVGTWYWGMEFEDVNDLPITYGQGRITVLPEVVLPET